MTESDLKQKILSEIYSKGFTEFYHGNFLNLFPEIRKISNVFSDLGIPISRYRVPE